jgi:hypothetical protein
MSNNQLEGVFSHALDIDIPDERPRVITVSHVGNWKALYPTLQEKFPGVRLSYGARYPVVLCSREALYLKQIGPAGVLQFKESVHRMSCYDGKIFIFDAQKIDFLRSNSRCMDDIATLRHVAMLFFREAIDPAISGYLASQKHVLDWQPKTVCPTSVSVIATKLSASILRDEFDRVARIVTVGERKTLETIKDELFEAVGPETEDLFLEGSFGVKKLREFARRKIVIALLRVTTPSYSVKSGRDPVEFFREVLSEKFIRHELPVGYVNDVSPNLSFVVKSQRRFSELRLGSHHTGRLS